MFANGFCKKILEKTIKEKALEYEIGRKHLAKIMGFHPFDDVFEQQDINVSLSVSCKFI